MKFTVHQIARVLGVAAPLGEDRLITGWSIDSRTVAAGDLFIALKGPNHDAHVYVADVLRKGASAAIVDQEVVVDWADQRKLIRVNDSLAALQQLSAWARRQWGGQVIAVTGSAGKTTTKETIASLLEEGLATTKTQGNLNNHVGLPLSILRLDETAQVAVLELGMNHAGEIRELSAIAQPNIGVVTNVGHAHIENFESIEGIAAAKRELIEALPADGVAVLNADDSRVCEFGRAHAGRTIFYGQSPDADVCAQDVEYLPEGIRFRVGQTRFESSLIGRHGVSTIAAAIATAAIFGIAPERLVDRVRALAPAKMRGEKLRHNGILIWNDCYNSNPDAAAAMLDVLRDTPARRRIAVLGEMLELGHWAESLHRSVGSHAVECGIDVLVGIRGAARHLLQGAQDAATATGSCAVAAFFFEDSADAGRFVKTLAQPGDAILFKGSRGVHVERALEEFLAGPAASPMAASPTVEEART
jgi:UDP-N-acetylmuramoyl-tripeptide--D-alanyl-D-alanine ligase